MKFKTKEDLYKNHPKVENKEGNRDNYWYRCGVHDAFMSFIERVYNYDRYRFNMRQMCEDHPELIDKYVESKLPYDKWLYNLCFGGIE